jgi:hypothetical protein
MLEHSIEITFRLVIAVLNVAHTVALMAIEFNEFSYVLLLLLIRLG